MFSLGYFVVALSCCLTRLLPNQADQALLRQELAEAELLAKAHNVIGDIEASSSTSSARACGETMSSRMRTPETMDRPWQQSRKLLLLKTDDAGRVKHVLIDENIIRTVWFSRPGVAMRTSHGWSRSTLRPECIIYFLGVTPTTPRFIGRELFTGEKSISLMTHDYRLLLLQTASTSYHVHTVSLCLFFSGRIHHDEGR